MGKLKQKGWNWTGRDIGSDKKMDLLSIPFNGTPDDGCRAAVLPSVEATYRGIGRGWDDKIGMTSPKMSC